MNIGIGAAGYMSNFMGFGCPKDYAITADTTPDCDRIGFDCFWEGKHWITLHQEKVKKYGKAKADIDWATEWMKCRGVMGAFGHELFIANNDMAFRNYVNAHGLTQTVSDLKMITTTGKVGDAVVNTTGNAAQLVSNLSDTAADTSAATDKLAKWFPYIVLAGVLLIGFLIYKKGSLNIVTA